MNSEGLARLKATGLNSCEQLCQAYTVSQLITKYEKWFNMKVFYKVLCNFKFDPTANNAKYAQSAVALPSIYCLHSADQTGQNTDTTKMIKLKF